MLDEDVCKSASQFLHLVFPACLPQVDDWCPSHHDEVIIIIVELGLLRIVDKHISEFLGILVACLVDEFFQFGVRLHFSSEI